MKNLATIVVLLVLLYANISFVNAHGREELILVENNELELYSDPTPTQLKIADHILKENLTSGQSLKVETNNEAVDYENFSAEWNLTDGRSFKGNSVEILFEKSGSYFIDLMILDENNNALAESSLLVNVGEGFEAPEFKVGDSSISENSQVVEVSKTENVAFAVLEPQENFTYTWDLAGETLVEGSTTAKNFMNTQLPKYIFLRTTNNESGVFVDQYVRIASDEDSNYMPARPVRPDFDPNKEGYEPIRTFPEWHVVVLLVIVGAVFVILLGFMAMAVKKKLLGPRG